jgi:hypothetical protein
MLLFLLLLVTSGLMYFYFMKSRMLERELEQWRTGVKVQETTRLVKTAESPLPAETPAPVASNTPMPAPPLPDSLPGGELPAPPSAATRPTPAPTSVPALSNEVLPGLNPDAARSDPMTTAQLASPGPRSTPRIRSTAASAPEPPAATRKPSGPIRSAYDLAGPEPQETRTPVPTVRVPRRQSQTPRPDAIGDIRLGRDRNEIQD